MKKIYVSTNTVKKFEGKVFESIKAARAEARKLEGYAVVRLHNIYFKDVCYGYVVVNPSDYYIEA